MLILRIGAGNSSSKVQIKQVIARLALFITLGQTKGLGAAEIGLQSHSCWIKLFDFPNK